jgi:predicted Zn-ribbon and HTH transcriptional regulator
MTTISIFNGKERDKRYAILLWHDVETGRDTIARLDETDAATLRDTLTTWLDAPRLAARATAEVVTKGGGLSLLRSTAGEWAVRYAPGVDAQVSWHATECPAREEYATERDKALCICGAECDADEIDRSGDEPQCPKCVAEAVEAFKSQPMRCTRCDWTGTGADVADDPEACPKCTYYSVEDIDTAKEPGQ